MPQPKHSVHFDDTPENWLKWGRLVDRWIFTSSPGTDRPHNRGELEDQMRGLKPSPTPILDPNHPITGIELGGTPAPIPNSERNRPVNVLPYNNHGNNITINIPDQVMALLDKNWLATIGTSSYPVRSFYSAMFGGAPVSPLSPAALEEMRLRRVGEYVINECM